MQAVALAVLVLAGCESVVPSATPGEASATPGEVSAAPAPTSTAPETPAPTPTPEPSLPPVVGAEPSQRVAAFYYPWYETGTWENALHGSSIAQNDIESDYYPVLGPYSSLSRAVVAQHMAWLRSAGVGVIVSSWWGRASSTDGALPVLLEMGERYGVKVAIHLEPYADGRPARLVDDVRYLYERYGASPAFFRTSREGRYARRGIEQPLLFLYALDQPLPSGPAPRPKDWRAAIDAVHALPEGGLVIGTSSDPAWIEGAHLDGAYNYATLDQNERIFDWAKSLPPGALFVPCVLPGYSDTQLGRTPSTVVDRRAGATYDGQWRTALATGVEPALVGVTSFNEWFEGTTIEPAAAGHVSRDGRAYADFAPLAPDAYLVRTAGWVRRFEAMAWPSTTRARIRMSTTSDWTRVRFVGATVVRPVRVGVSGTVRDAGTDGEFFGLSQAIERAEAGRRVSVTFDLEFSELAAGATLRLEDPAREPGLDDGRALQLPGRRAGARPVGELGRGDRRRDELADRADRHPGIHGPAVLSGGARRWFDRRLSGQPERRSWGAHRKGGPPA